MDFFRHSIPWYLLLPILGLCLSKNPEKKTFKNKIINFLVCSPKPFLLMKPTYSSWEFSSSRLNGEIKLTFTRRFSKLNKIWNKKNQEILIGAVKCSVAIS